MNASIAINLPEFKESLINFIEFYFINFIEFPL